jgi:DNA polymerase elongation subunit (family B)
MKVHKLKFNWRSIAHIDMMKRFISLFNLPKNSLEYVSNHFLGEGKIKHSGKRIIDMYKNEPELLRQYNIQDVKLLKELDEKVDCFKLMIKEAKWCNTFMSYFYVSELLDNYILKNAKDKNIICPSKNEIYEKSKYTGAIVLEPERGLYNDVYVFDFSSLYPSIIMTSNIGFDTLDENGEITNPGSGFKFTNKKKSIVKETIEGMIGKRKQYKDQKLKMIEEGKNKGPEFETIVSNEYVVKALTNSIYGIMGMQQSRWYSVEIAESITKMGQWLINFTKDYFENHGFKVIYGDTDSVMVVDNKEKDIKNNMYDILQYYHNELGNELNKYGITESFINLEDDKTFSKYLLVDKKNYTGIASSLNGKKTNELYTKGLDYIKRNTIKYASNKQKQLIKYILFDNYNLDDCIYFIEECQREVIDGKLQKDDLIVRMKITKSPDEYQSKLPHVIVARRIIEKTGLLQNYEIEYIVKDNISKEYLMVEEYEDNYDEYFYWNNRIFNLLKRIVNVAFPNEDWERFYMKKIRVKSSKKIKENQLFLDF